MANNDTATEGLTDLIESRGLTRHALAMKANIPDSTLRRHLIDGDFTLGQLRAISTALDVPVLTLLNAIDADQNRTAA